MFVYKASRMNLFFSILNLCSKLYAKMEILHEIYKKLQKKHPQSKGLVIFDGGCVLCNRSVGYLLKADYEKKLLYTSFGSSLFSALKLEGQVKRNPTQSLIFINNDGIFTESDAALKIAETIHIPRLLVRLGWLTPRFLRNFIYRIIARYRYSWFGKTNQCIVPSREDAGRFYLRENADVNSN